MKRSLVLAVAMAITTISHAAPVSGRYGPTLLVVDGKHLSGVIGDTARGNGTDEAPQFMCRALVTGRFDGDVAELVAWLPDDPQRIAGTLTRDGADIHVRLDENPPGCGMVSNMTGDGQRWWLEEARPDWIAVGIVTTERAILHSEPTEDTERERPYLVEWDVVAVLEQRGDWARVEYVQSDPLARGWIKVSDLALAGPGEE
ncbi:hypothetical protein [Aliihoeflea sp. PC F10.4]